MTLEWKKKIVFVHNPLGEQSVFRTIFSFYPVCTRIHPRIRYFFGGGASVLQNVESDALNAFENATCNWS